MWEVEAGESGVQGHHHHHHVQPELHETQSQNRRKREKHISAVFYLDWK